MPTAPTRAIMFDTGVFQEHDDHSGYADCTVDDQGRLLRYRLWAKEKSDEDVHIVDIYFECLDGPDADKALSDETRDCLGRFSHTVGRQMYELQKNKQQQPNVVEFHSDFTAHDEDSMCADCTVHDTDGRKLRHVLWAKRSGDGTNLVFECLDGPNDTVSPETHERMQEVLKSIAHQIQNRANTPTGSE